MDPQLVYLAVGGLVLVILGVVVVGPIFRRKPQPVGAGAKSEEGGRRPSKEGATSATAGPVDVYFGSQTGTAESFAKTIQKEGKKKGFAVNVHDLEDFSPEALKSQSLTILLLATYGEGDPTDNAMAFAKWLKDADKEIPEAFLQGMKYMVFALGDTQYEHFNAMGKLADKRFEELGAERLTEVFMGDASGALEDDFDKWREGMWEVLTKMCHPDAAGKVNGSPGRDGRAPTLPELPFKLTFVESANGHAHSNGSHIASSKSMSLDGSEVSASSKYYFTCVNCPITVNKELRQPADGGSTKHIEINIAGTGLQYLTADNLGILPENEPDVVQTLALSQGYDLNRNFVLEGGKALFPTPCSVKEALTCYIDLKGIPRRSTLAQLAPFARNPKQLERLSFLASKEGRQEYHAFVEKAGRCLFELMTDTFPSLQIPLDHLINLAPRLQPRYYTISSSSNAHPKSIHVTVAVTQATLPEGRGVHTGVCSGFLAKPSTRSIRCFVRPSSFRLPANPSTPIILVGPGTGIAPMRALLQERRHQRVVEKKAVGDTVLFFGCRKRDHDFLYEQELLEFTRDKTLTDLQLAFSREGLEKVYVQHLITKPETAKSLWDMLNEKSAHIYVCGGTKMGMDVLTAFGNMAKSVGKLDDKAATEYIKTLQNQGRYVQELWSA